MGGVLFGEDVEDDSGSGPRLALSTRRRRTKASRSSRHNQTR